MNPSSKHHLIGGKGPKETKINRDSQSALYSDGGTVLSNGWCKSLGITTRQNEGDRIRASNKLLFLWSYSNNVCMCSLSRSRVAVRTQDSDVFHHHHHHHHHAAEADVCFQSSQLKAAGKSKYNFCTYVCFFSSAISLRSGEPAGFFFLMLSCH